MSDERTVDELLRRLSLEEKIELLSGSTFWHTAALERLGLPALLLTDGPHGLRKQRDNADELGLSSSVPATCFPPAAGLASSWNPELSERVGAALGRESKSEGVAVLLGPGINIKRSPLCGRNFEYFSEDPLLAGALAAGWVQGVQKEGVGASLKHFAANNQETKRLTIDARVSDRALREIYLPAFETVVKQAQPWTVMCAYNKVNGTYSSENRWLLSDVLRDQWGFNGIVVSDWGAVNNRAHALAAGLDLEMPASGGRGARVIRDALNSGQLAESIVDQAASRVISLILKAAKVTVSPVDFAGHHDLAREAATQSAVLLKNEDHILPVATKGGTIAVIGEFARTPRYQGAGSSLVNPTRLDTALSQLQQRLDGRRPVIFAPGYLVETDEEDSDLVAEAIAAASTADQVVVFLGLPPSYESEGWDRDHLQLPAAQISLLSALAEVNKEIIVVLSNGAVVTTQEWEGNAKAILEAWLLGQAGGSAIVDLVLGDVSPSGKLAETIPLSLAQTPTFGSFPGENGTADYGEGLHVGYRWYDIHDLAVSYPFGFGLSYTEFEYGPAVATVIQDGPLPVVRVAFTLTNTGAVPGAEIVQLYVAPTHPLAHRPPQELKEFRRVQLNAGESASVELELTSRAFAHWDESQQDWAVDPDLYEIRVGSSSRDIRERVRVALVGKEIRSPLHADSSVEEWLGNEGSGQWLRDAIAGTPFETLFADPENGRMIRAFPLQRIARFPGSPLSDQAITDAVAKFATPDLTSVSDK